MSPPSILLSPYNVVAVYLFICFGFCFRFHHSLLLFVFECMCVSPCASVRLMCGGSDLFYTIQGACVSIQIACIYILSIYFQKRSQDKAKKRHNNVMRLLVRRYITAEQRKRDDFGITEDDVMEIRQDISTLRFELIDIFNSNGMKTPSIKAKDVQCN